MLQQNEAVCDGDVKEKVIDVLVKLLAALSTLILSSELVTVVHSSHKLVIQDDHLLTWNSDSGTVQPSSLDHSYIRWLTVGCHYHDNLYVLPSCSTHFAFLNHFLFSPIKSIIIHVESDKTANIMSIYMHVHVHTCISHKAKVIKIAVAL